LRRASSPASRLLTYSPVVFAFVGIWLEACFRHDEIITSTPFSKASSPRYAPQGHAAIATFTGLSFGLTPRLP
jgi:hypothetical protein